MLQQAILVPFNENNSEALKVHFSSVVLQLIGWGCQFHISVGEEVKWLLWAIMGC